MAKCYPSDDRIRTRKSFFEANDSQSEYKIEYRVQRADAGYSMAIAHGTPHYSSDGRFLGMFGITSTVHDYVEQASFIKTVDAPPRPKVLSDREREVLALFAEGYTVETVATKLRIAEGTVAHHVRNATLKLGALSRTHAVAKAILLSELQLSS